MRDEKERAMMNSSLTQGYLGLGVLLLLSCLWLGLSGLFDLLFGHFILGTSWERFLVDYQVRLSRIAIFVLVVAAISCLAIVGLGL